MSSPYLSPSFPYGAVYEIDLPKPRYTPILQVNKNAASKSACSSDSRTSHDLPAPWISQACGKHESCSYVDKTIDDGHIESFRRAAARGLMPEPPTKPPYRYREPDLSTDAVSRIAGGPIGPPYIPCPRDLYFRSNIWPSLRDNKWAMSHEAKLAIEEKWTFPEEAQSNKKSRKGFEVVTTAEGWLLRSLPRD